jgi:MFS family permease
MFTTQSAAMLLALLLAVLVSTGVVQLWMVIAIAAGRGIALSFNVPARQSLISELVPAQDLMNAVALNSATLNLTRVMGPAIGGGLLVTVGAAGAFYVNAASFVAVLWGLALMRFPAREAAPSRSVVDDLRGGFAYLRSHPSLRTLVLLALVPMVLGTPYQTMLTVFAKDVLNVGGGGLGILTACTGIGAMAGSLTVASLSERKRGRLMLAAMVGYGLSLLIFSTSPWFLLSVPLLVVVGLSQQLYMVINNSMIQTYVDPAYRGRVLSTLFLNRGLVPLGTLLASLGTALVGPQWAVGSMAALLLLLGLAANRLAGHVRDLD